MGEVRAGVLFLSVSDIRRCEVMRCNGLVMCADASDVESKA